jgi:hypothetical protein
MMWNGHPLLLSDYRPSKRWYRLIRFPPEPAMTEWRGTWTASFGVGLGSVMPGRPGPGFAVILGALFAWRRDGASRSVMVSLRKRLASKACGQNAGELRAVGNVLVLASQRVLERSLGGVCLLDSLFELGELVAGKLPPGIGGCPFRCHEHRCLGEREPDIAKEHDHPDALDRCGAVAPLARDPQGRGNQAKLLVVAKSRGSNACALGELADGKQLTGHLDFKCT